MNIVYIDAQNIHKGIQVYHGRTLDWGKFFVYCKERLSADKVKIFFGYVPAYRSLYMSLEQIGYDISFKDTLILPDGTIKGNVDIDIAIVAVEDFFSSMIERAYLVTGDGDYNSLISFWKKKEVFGDVLVPGVKNSSKLLHKVAGKNIIDIAQMQKKLQKENLSSTT